MCAVLPKESQCCSLISFHGHFSNALQSYQHAIILCLVVSSIIYHIILSPKPSNLVKTITTYSIVIGLVIAPYFYIDYLDVHITPARTNFVLVGAFVPILRCLEGQFISLCSSYNFGRHYHELNLV